MKKKARRGELGSALTEGAIIAPILILVVYWSVAMTDVMVLKIKAQEAARFALWEMTVFRDPGSIETDVATRFADLKSPATVNDTKTGLVLYPKPTDLSWIAVVNPTYQPVSFGGNIGDTSGQSNGTIAGAVGALTGPLSKLVDSWVKSEGFNTNGSASATVSLNATRNHSVIMNGGEVLGANFTAPPVLQHLNFAAPLAGERPLRLVYDTWKAWPKPVAYMKNGASGALVDPSVSPMQSYPVVESMVSQQVSRIAFFGLGQYGWFQSLNNALGSFFSNGIVQGALGGDVPTMFDTNPMDHALTSFNTTKSGDRGPITILPVAAPDVGWVPGGGLLTNRLGDLGSSNTSVTQNDDNWGMGAGADQSRYTVPYRINTKWWTQDGGTQSNSNGSAVSSPSSNIATKNNYVTAFGCRGHYFAGATKPQITDPTKRYTGGGCTN